MPQQILQKEILVKVDQKVSNILGYFCKQFCYEELSKIAQFDHNELKI